MSNQNQYQQFIFWTEIQTNFLSHILYTFILIDWNSHCSHKIYVEYTLFNEIHLNIVEWVKMYVVLISKDPLYL